MHSYVRLSTAYRCQSPSLRPLTFFRNWNVIAKRALHPNPLPSGLLGPRSFGRAAGTIRHRRLNFTMASKDGSQSSTSSATTPPSSSSGGKPTMFRRKFNFGDQQIRHSHDKSLDSVWNSTTSLVPEAAVLPGISTTAAALGARSASAPASPTTTNNKITHVPAIDEDSIFLTSSSKQKIRLTESEETLLSALFCRVQDSRKPGPQSILRDPYAQSTLERCEVDLSRSTFGMQPGVVVWAAHRARTLDDWCVDFVNSSGEGSSPVTVVHLGCGLDGRYLRVRDRFRKGVGDVHWVDVDRPMVVDLRDRIFRRPAPTPGEDDNGDHHSSNNNPPHQHGENYILRTLDLSRRGWARDIPTGCGPTLVIAEGLLCYLDPEVVHGILHEVVEYFGRGQIIFDKLGTVAVSLTSRVRFLKASKSAFKWAVDDPKEIEEIHPGLKLKDCVDKKTFMSGCIPIYGKWNPLVSMHPGNKYDGQFVRFEF